MTSGPKNIHKYFWSLFKNYFYVCSGAVQYITLPAFSDIYLQISWAAKGRY